MLLENSDIWATRVQSIGALLTVCADGRDEIYYLATVCQVGLNPPLISISPNPEYPVCDAITSAGYFGLSFLAADQDDLVRRCIALDKHARDKLVSLGLQFERTEQGTPLLLDCLQALECCVERWMDTGDHRCMIGSVTSRRTRETHRQRLPHLFGGPTPAWKRWIKTIVYRSRLYDLRALAGRAFRRPMSIEEGTRHHIPDPE